MILLESLKNSMSGLFGKEDQVPHYEEDLIDLVEKEFKRRQEERRPYELQWRLNIAFFEGDQYVDINTASMAIEEQPPLYHWQEREVFNQIAPNIETRISKLKRIRPILKCQPGTTDQEDFFSAKVGTALLKNTYNDQEIRDKLNDAYNWSELCGSAFFKHIWNPELGRVVGVTIDEETGQEVEIREGEMEIVLCPPQEIYPDTPWAQDVKDCRSIIHARNYHIDDIEEIWGVVVDPEEAQAEQLQRTMVGHGGLGYGQGGFRVRTVKLKEHAIVKEYWERPTKQFPEGRLIIIANGKVLYTGPLPYMVADDAAPGIPFSKLDCLRRMGCFWGRTIIERLIPVQRRYNALRNRKAEYLNRVAIGQYDVEDGAVDMDTFEADAGCPGSVTVYQRGHNPPTPRGNQPLPSAFDTEENTLKGEFSVLSGVSEINRQSVAPPGVKSGVALAILQEQDDSRLSNTVDNIERFLIHSGKIQLRLLKQYVQAPRTLQLVGKNNVAEIMDWTGADIRSDDVILDTFNANAESPAQKRQMVFDLLESGLLNDPETGQMSKEMRSKILDVIALGEWESADDTEQLHISKAERENRQLEQGVPVYPVSYDEHVLHISRHNKYRLTTDYEELLWQNPAVEQMFTAHIQMHLIYMMPPQAVPQGPMQPQPMEGQPPVVAPDGGGGMDEPM